MSMSLGNGKELWLGDGNWQSHKGGFQMNNRSEKFCCVANCGKPGFCRGRCRAHYAQLRRMSKAQRAELYPVKRKMLVRPTALQKPETPQRDPYIWPGNEEALIAEFGEKQ